MNAFSKNAALIVAAVATLSYAAQITRGAGSGHRRKRATRTSTGAILPKLHGKIAYQSGSELCVINPDGSGKRVLSESVVAATPTGGLDFSPDLKKIVYISSRPNREPYEGTNIWIANCDGTHRRQLVPVNKTDHTDSLVEPRFSPDGRQILYTRWTGAHMGGPMTASADIWVINADGSGKRCVIGDYFKSDYARYQARWSRDGRRIFFLQVKDGIPESNEAPPPVGEPMSVNLDGIDARSAAGEEHLYLLDGLSLDGRKRAVWELRDKNNEIEYGKLALQNSNGTETKIVLSDPNLVVSGARFSPDGKNIVFNAATQKDLQGNGSHVSIRILNIDGTGMRTLVTGRGANLFVSQWLH